MIPNGTPTNDREDDRNQANSRRNRELRDDDVPHRLGTPGRIGRTKFQRQNPAEVVEELAVKEGTSQRRAGFVRRH